jgi:hypothetical protein
MLFEEEYDKVFWEKIKKIKKIKKINK